MVDMRDRKIKLIVSDIDGTLLSPENRLLPQTEEAVRAALDKDGLCFTIGTGRSFPLTIQLVEYLGIQAPFIYSSGAIFDPHQQRVISAVALQKHQVEAVIQIARKYVLGIIAHTTAKMYCQVCDSDWGKISALEWLKNKHSDHAIRVENILTDIQDEIIRLDIFGEIDWLDTVYLDLCRTIQDVHAVLMKRSIEITQEGVHKGSALRLLAEHIQIPTSKIMAVGDSLNDVPLLRSAGIGVAMGTAPIELQAIADIVVPGAHENGLAQAIRSIQN